MTVKIKRAYAVDNAAHAHILAADKLEFNAPHAGKAYFIADDEPVELDLVEYLDDTFGENTTKQSTAKTSVWTGCSHGICVAYVWDTG